MIETDTSRMILDSVLSIEAKSPREEISEEHKKYILEKLNEAEAYAAHPDAKWHTWEEVRNTLRERHGV